MTKRTLSQLRNVKPGLETLEDRCTPAMVSSQLSDTLSIVGSGTGGTVYVQSNANGSLSVTTAGVTTNYTGINNISANFADGTTNALYIDLRAHNIGDIHIVGSNSGDDTVGIGVGNAYWGNAHTIEADLGNGNNTFTYRAENTDANDSLGVTYFGGTGSDDVTYRLGNLASSASIKTETVLGDGLNTFHTTTDNMGASANVLVDLVGGDDTDAVNLDLGTFNANAMVTVYSSLKDGDDTFRATTATMFDSSKLELHVDAGAGADRAFVGFDRLTAHAVANVDMAMGDGNDRATFDYPKLADDSAAINLALDGGSGFDRSSNAGLENVMKNIYVDSNTFEA